MTVIATRDTFITDNFTVGTRWRLTVNSALVADGTARQVADALGQLEAQAAMLRVRLEADDAA